MWRLVGRNFYLSMMMLGMIALSTLAGEPQGIQTVTLGIDGMTCGACVKDVRASLTKVPGVSSVEMTVGKKWVVFSDYTDARARVTFDPAQAGIDQLVKAIEAASNPLSAYKARVRDKR
ncbi:MAG TPA: heavy-metal-associated domain-containing protein [Nitrospira sp.]|nr:heavy-metal-associated domain-containing protein [Nitrospira sp.]